MASIDEGIQIDLKESSPSLDRSGEARTVSILTFPSTQPFLRPATFHFAGHCFENQLIPASWVGYHPMSWIANSTPPQ
jgi:hypothetical protein